MSVSCTSMLALAMSAALVAQGQVRLAPERKVSLLVGLVSLRADGTQRGTAFSGGGSEFVYYLQVAGPRCTLTASSSEPAGTPRVAWRVEGHVANATPDGVAAHVKWERVWDAGIRTPGGPRGTTDVTLRRNESLLLDSLPIAPDADCDASTVRLEILSGPVGGVMSASGVGRVGRGAGAGVAHGVSRGAGVGVSGGGGFGRAGTASAPAQGRRVTEPVDLEVWLVHQPPQGAEAVQRIAMQGVPGTAVFEFPLVPIGSLGVELTGRISAMLLPTGGPVLELEFHRRVHDGSGAPVASTGRRTLPMPAADDVVSFEIPAVNGPQAQALQGHRFSLRVRIKPGEV